VVARSDRPKRAVLSILDYIDADSTHAERESRKGLGKEGQLMGLLARVVPAVHGHPARPQAAAATLGLQRRGLQVRRR